MGFYCSAHLQSAIRLALPNAKDGEVTVKDRHPLMNTCTYCGAPAEFAVSYFSK